MPHGTRDMVITNVERCRRDDHAPRWRNQSRGGHKSGLNRNTLRPNFQIWNPPKPFHSPLRLAIALLEAFESYVLPYTRFLASSPRSACARDGS
jgi:hypothetical protein